MLYFKLGSEEEYATKLLFQAYNCFKRWGSSSKQFHMAKRYSAIANALKDSSNELEVDPESYKILEYDAESVSIITEALSLTCLDT